MLLSSGGVTLAASQGQNSGPVAKSGGAPATGVSGWVVVNADGTIAKKLNAKLVVHSAGGTSYTVYFNSNVRGCAYTGNVGLGGASGYAGAGYITVVGASVSVKAVYVTPFDGAGNPVEKGFHLVVTC